MPGTLVVSVAVVVSDVAVEDKIVGDVSRNPNKLWRDAGDRGAGSLP